MNRSATTLWRAIAALLVAATLGFPLPTRAQPGVTLAATPAFEGNYTPGAWLPIEVRLRNDGPPVVATVAVAQPDAPFRNVQTVELPTGAEKQLTLYAAMEESSRALRLTVEDGDAVLAEQELAVRPRVDERLLGVLAAGELQLSLPRREDMDALPFTTVRLTPEGMPERAAGLSSLSLLLLSGAPADALSATQREALLGWVASGGHLVLGGGAEAARAVAGLPPQLQPAALGAATEVPDAALGALAAGEGPGPLPGVALAPAPDAQAFGDGAAPAWVTRRVGQGAVTQLAFDPGLPALGSWPGTPQFWDRLLRPPTMVSTPFGLQPRADAIQEQILAGALTNLPALSLPPSDVIFAILALYAVLVGPGLALLLRRYDRQAWGWVAVPALALGTSAAVFGLAIALRADQRVISQISLVELVGGGQARARTYVGALSPQSQTLAAELTAPALVRPVRGASGTYGTVGGARGDLSQESAAADLSLEAWQLQGLLAEGQLPLEGIVAELSVGPGGPRVELRNDSAQTLRGAVAVYGELVAFLGDLRPAERLQAVWPAAPSEEDVPRGTPISYLVLREELDAGRRAGQAPSRAVLAREALINAAVARGSAGFDEGPLVLAWLDQSPLAFDLDLTGAASQSTTLLVLRPTVRGGGPVELPRGWLRPDLTAGGRAPCNGDLGAGVRASPAPVTIAMRLPDGLAALRAEAITLTLESAGRWPNAGVTTEVFDWARSEWVAQSFDGPGDLTLPEAGPYLLGGQLMLRLSGPIENAQCLYAAATVRGSMP